MALNPEWFTLAPENTTEELQNGAKDINTSLIVLFWLSVWKMWCKGKIIALGIKEQKWA